MPAFDIEGTGFSHGKRVGSATTDRAPRYRQPWRPGEWTLSARPTSCASNGRSETPASSVAGRATRPATSFGRPHGAGTKEVARKATENEDDGDPRKTEFAEKGSPGLVMEVVQRQAERVVQRQAPPPGPDWVAPAGRASLNCLAILNDAVPTGSNWGVTHFDDPVIDITAYASGGSWSCMITQADEQTHQGVRLLPGQVEVTPALVAGEASCPRLKTMRTSLDSIASQGPKSGFYMIAAVQAHEDVHVSQYRAGMPPHYTTLKTAIEALTVPFAGTATAAAAKAAIKALPAYTAVATFHAADVAENNKTGTHSPVAPFNTAEHGVVDPMVTTIRARETALACPP